MNVLFVTYDHSLKNFGVTTVVSQLANEISIRNNDTKIFIAATGGNPVHQCEAVTVDLLPPANTNAFWRWSPNLSGRLNNLVTKYHIDLIHVHGIWAAIQWAVLNIAKNKNIPSIVSSHAMLEPWYWNMQGPIKKYKKVLYFKIIFKNSITENTNFHAITSIEKENLQKLLPRQKIVVIPNAVSLDVDINRTEAGNRVIPEKYFLFLGRIHPVKGVDLLVNAFYQANLADDWKLILAGPESAPQYSMKIRKTVDKLGLSSRVLLLGPVYGAEKQRLIQKSWAVVFPSFCETIGMVNLEASACMVPSITTYETGLWDWEEGGGLLIHPNVDDLARSLRKVSRWSLAERLYFGGKSFDLVANHYSWNTVVPQWEALYSSFVKNRQ